MKIKCILTNGFEEVEALATIALLRRSGIQVDIYTLDNTKAIGKYEIEIHQLLPLDNNYDYDALLIPGGPHYAILEASDLVKDNITAFHQMNKYICAICAAPTILGHMGLLKNKRYTCFTSMNEDFKGTYIDEYVVVDDHLISARSAAASIEFAFAIITCLQGKQQADKIKQDIYY